MSDPGEAEIEDRLHARAGLILGLRQRGILNPAFLNAFEQVPHEAFVPPEFEAFAYRERSLPIQCGQSITSPMMLASMLAPLEPVGANKLLEVGTGSGYSAALLSRLARRVITVERHLTLARAAEARWKKLGYGNIIGLHEDGMRGLPFHAPFARILVTASVAELPQGMVDQLDDGGVLVAAVGKPDEKQVITRAERAGEDVIVTEHGFVRLSPLIPGKSRAI